jgi:hypothetical protein
VGCRAAFVRLAPSLLAIHTPAVVAW